MATANVTYAVTGSVYQRYSSSKVLELLEMDKPMLEDSENALGLDLGEMTATALTQNIQPKNRSCKIHKTAHM